MNAHTLGWTLVHSIWEIVVVAAVLGVLLVFGRPVNSRTRYGLSLAALFACFVGPVITYFALLPSNDVVITSYAVASNVGVLPIQAASSTIYISPPTPTESFAGRIDPFLPYLVVFWLVGLTLMCLRLVAGLVSIERLKRHAIVVTEDRWQETVSRLGVRFGVVPPIKLLISSSVDSPATVGFLKSIVILPASALTSLAPEFIEALIAHEIAHIRRYDYLVNIVQSFIETALFYHPALWWISHVVRTERENCCDDMAIQVIGDRACYARALVGMEELRFMPQLVMAANRQSLPHRIRRILMKPQQRIVPTPLWATLTLASCLLVSLGFSQAFHLPNKKMKSEHLVPIHGRVLTKSGKPASGVTVYSEIHSFESGSQRQERTISDSKGNFTLAISPKGYYNVVAFQKGHGYGQQIYNSGANPILQFGPVQPMKVRVLDAKGEPVAHTKVGVSSIANGAEGTQIPRELFEATSKATDPNGFVTLDDLPVGKYIALNLNDDHLVEKPVRRVWKVGNPNTKCDLVVERACEIHGSVSLNGNPIGGASIWATGSNGSIGESASTDDHGQFELKQLPQADMTLMCTLHGDLQDEYVVVPQKLTLKQDRPTNVSMVATQGATVIGKPVSELGKPVSDAFVSFQLIGGGGVFGPRQRARDGSFKLRIPPGKYKVSTSNKWDFKVQELVLKEGETKELSFKAPSGKGVIETVCKVIDADGKPIPGCDVQYRWRDSKRHGFTSNVFADRNGVARVHLPVDQSQTLLFEANVGNQFSEPSVAPVNGQAILKLHRVALSSVEGVVTDLQGKPISDARVSIVFLGAGRFIGDMETIGKWEIKSDLHGRYRFKGIYPSTQVFIVSQAQGLSSGQSKIVRTVAGRTTVLSAIRLSRR